VRAAKLPSLIGCELLEHKSSTAWSTARMPVDSHSHSGVATVTAGSRITEVGIMLEEA
jgi:hypothetical protein